MEGTDMSRRVAATCAVLALTVHAQQSPRTLDYAKVGVYGTIFDFCDYSVFKLRVPKNETYLPQMAKRLADVHAQGRLNLLGLYCFDRIKHARPVGEYLANADRMLKAIDLTKVHAIFLSEENVTWNKGLELLNTLYDHIKANYDVPVYQWYSTPMLHHPKQRADGWIIDPYGMRRDAFRKYLMKYLVMGKPIVDCLHASPHRDPAGTRELHEATRDQIAVCRELNVPMFFFCVDTKYGSPSIWLHSDDPEVVSAREWLLSEVSKIRATDTSKLPLTSADYSTGQPIPVAGDKNHRFTYEDRFDTVREGFMDDAFINGFSLLRWDGEEERLHVRPGRGARNSVDLIYHFASEFEMSGMAATLTGTLLTEDACPSLTMSINGHRFEHEAAAERPGAFTLRSDANDSAEFIGKEFWVKLRAAVGQTPAEPIALDSFRVTCRVAPPERREVALKPSADGTISYADDFQTQKHLHLTVIENLDHLEWRRGYVGTHGITGHCNVVTLKQKFVCDRALSALQVRMSSTAHRTLGSSNTLALSLDGEKPILSESTRGKEQKNGRYRGTIEIDASKDKRFANVKVFWVHLTMINGCGKATRTSNRITGYEVRATVSAEER